MAATTGGEITFGQVTNTGGGSFLSGFSAATQGAAATTGLINLDNNITIDNPNNVTAVSEAGVTLDGNFDYLGGTANFNNGSASFVTTSGTGFIEIEATNGSASQVVMTSGSFSAVRGHRRVKKLRRAKNHRKTAVFLTTSIDIRLPLKDAKCAPCWLTGNESRDRM